MNTEPQNNEVHVAFDAQHGRHYGVCKNGSLRGVNPATADVIYSEEELEFLKAISNYKKKYNRPFPTWHEVLAVFKGLGYRKQKKENPP